MAAPHVASFDRCRFPPDVVAGAKGSRRVSVCLPARNEEATVGPIVAEISALAARWGVVDEILVVDDGSEDTTASAAAAAGARVVAADDVLPELGPGTGKGEALWKAVAAATGDLLVFCDADIRHFDATFVTGLLGPLVTNAGFGFVKGTYERPLEGSPGEGGRVTELVARPLVSLLFPHLAVFGQPLAGEFAARRDVLEQVPFVAGYGVDLALLIDVVALLGLDGVAQVELGRRIHRNRPLAELNHQARVVIQAALSRAGLGTHPRVDPLAERPPLGSLKPWPGSSRDALRRLA